MHYKTINTYTLFKLVLFKAPGENMKIEKRENGKYRLRKTVEGKTYTLTTDEKPTKRNIDEWVASLYKKKNLPTTVNMTFETAAKIYVNTKENVLSASTVKEYRGKIKRIPEWFLQLKLPRIDYYQVQNVINEYSVGHSPKTVRDINAFIASVLAYFDVGITKSINLPQKVKQTSYLPTDDDIKVLLQAAKGTMYEAMIGLGVCGLRRSEICCIEASDVKNNVVYITKALVQNEKKQWVIKTTKTTESTRDVPIPKELADLIIKNGKAYSGYPGSINKWLTNTLKDLGIPHFSFHKLRHYFASKLICMGYSKREVEILGGWGKNSQVLEKIYSQAMLTTSEDGRRNIMNRFTEGLF